MKIIDETYNGAKYPIVEREFNAYYFPDNYNPDNIPQQADGVYDAFKNHWETKIYNRANPR